MEISSNKPIGNPVRSVEPTPKIREDQRERQETPQQRKAGEEESPDYRISLSDESKQAVTERAGRPTAGPSPASTELSESEAARLAEQTAEQLSRTDTAIAKQAIQKAVDLFT